MPEIIDFSSRQFYSDAPLIPVRHYGADLFTLDEQGQATKVGTACEDPDLSPEEILAECVAASRHVLAREYYKALMSARKIVEYEERVLNVASGLHSGDSEG